MKYKEDDLQEATAKYLDSLGVLWCHVANERRTSPQAGARLKRKGVKSGVPDCMVFEPKGMFNGLAIELKIKPNKISVNQKDWITKLSLNNWFAVVCYDLDDVIETVQSYLRLKKQSEELKG